MVLPEGIRNQTISHHPRIRLPGDMTIPSTTSCFYTTFPSTTSCYYFFCAVLLLSWTACGYAGRLAAVLTRFASKLVVLEAAHDLSQHVSSTTTLPIVKCGRLRRTIFYYRSDTLDVDCLCDISRNSQTSLPSLSRVLLNLPPTPTPLTLCMPLLLRLLLLLSWGVRSHAGQVQIPQ